MSLSNDLWLRGQAAQHAAFQLATYNAALTGAASLQALRLGWTAPQVFWGALARAATANDVAPQADVTAERHA